MKKEEGTNPQLSVKVLRSGIKQAMVAAAQDSSCWQVMF
jgi:hypothetical protein